MSVLIGLLVVAAGGVGVVWGYNRRSYQQAVAGTETTRALDVDEPGVVELKGEVVEVDGDGSRMEAPLSGEPCVAAGWEVDEWNESGKSSSWHTIAEGYESVPFLVDDGSARIRVEPGADSDASNWTTNLPLGDLDDSVSVDGATLDFQSLAVRHQVAPDDPKPARVEAFERRAPGIDEQSGAMLDVLDFGTAHGERKYKEGVVRPGDDVYLLGTVEPTHRDAAENVRLRPEDAVVRPTGEDEFILSTRTEDDLLRKTRWGLPAMILGGIVSATGVVFLIAG